MHGRKAERAFDERACAGAPGAVMHRQTPRSSPRAFPLSHFRTVV